MLDYATDTQDRLAILIYALRRDPESWHGWHCLHFSLPGQHSPEKLATVITQVETLMVNYLPLAEGYIARMGDRDLVVIARHVDIATLVESGMQAVELTLQEANAMPLYEVYELAVDSESFITMIQARTRLISNTAAAPPSTESTQALLRACNDQAATYNESEKLNLFDTCKVMLVEDDPVTRWLVRNALKDTCHFATASTASKAIELFKSFRPDVVFLDIGLPDRSGISVLEWITEHDPGAKVVMFTQQDNFDTMTTAIQNGACGFVAKPFHRDRLLHYIQKG